MKLIGILLLALAAALVWLHIFTSPAPQTQPAIRMPPTPAHGPRPQRLTPDEQQESVSERRRAKG